MKSYSKECQCILQRHIGLSVRWSQYFFYRRIYHGRSWLSNHVRQHGSKEARKSPPQPQERQQENGEVAGDNTDFHVILSSLLKILELKTDGSYKKVILDEKISIKASESILCIPQQQFHFSDVLQVD